MLILLKINLLFNKLLEIIVVLKNQFCNEEKHEPSASSFEISQNAPHYDEEIGVSGQELCDELYSSPFCFDIKIDESQVVDIFNVISEVSYIHGYDKSVVQNHYEDALIFDKYDDEIEKKNPEMCEVCDMAQSDQQIQECIQSIILEQPKPMHDSYPFEYSVEKKVQSADIIGDCIKKFTEQIQADPDVFYRKCLIDIHGTKYSYGQLVFSQSRKR